MAESSPAGRNLRVIHPVVERSPGEFGSLRPEVIAVCHCFKAWRWCWQV